MHIDLLRQGLPVAALLALLLSPAAAQQEPCIGNSAPITGPAAFGGSAIKYGTEVAIDEINEKGGVLGKKLEAVVVDPASNWQPVLTGARELVDLWLHVAQCYIHRHFSVGNSKRKSKLKTFFRASLRKLIPRTTNSWMRIQWSALLIYNVYELQVLHADGQTQPSDKAVTTRRGGFNSDRGNERPVILNDNRRWSASSEMFQIFSSKKQVFVDTSSIAAIYQILRIAMQVQLNDVSRGRIDFRADQSILKNSILDRCGRSGTMSFLRGDRVPGNSKSRYIRDKQGGAPAPLCSFWARRRQVPDGRVEESADCVCKTSDEFFLMV